MKRLIGLLLILSCITSFGQGTRENKIVVHEKFEVKSTGEIVVNDTIIPITDATYVEFSLNGTTWHRKYDSASPDLYMRISNDAKLTWDVFLTAGLRGGAAVSGLGMDFDAGDPIDLGLPSEVNSTTNNIVTEHSHSHKLGTIDISSVTKANGYGALYNWYAVTDSRNIAPVGFHVPSRDEFITLVQYLDPSEIWGSTNVAGGKVKESGVLYWNSPNLDATNESGFNGRGIGERTPTFIGIKETSRFWTTLSFGSVAAAAAISCGDGIFNYWAAYDLINGNPLRFIADSGTPTTATGNDGKVYPCVTIGTQTWTALNSSETKYRNGDWIHGYDGGVYTPIDNATWDALTTEAMCYYDDNEALGGSTPTPILDVFEPYLGLPSENNLVLGSDTDGNRSWVEVQLADSSIILKAGNGIVLTEDDTTLTVSSPIIVTPQNLSGTTITMNATLGVNGVLTLTGTTTLTITNLTDGYEGSIEVTNGSSAYTLDINGSTGYTTEKVKGTNAAIDSTVSSHTTVAYWRRGSVLYYGFIYDN